MVKKNKGTRRRSAANKPVVLANNQAPVINRPKAKKKKSKGEKGSRVKPHHVRGVCAITDPFCGAAKGSKFPDGTVGNTMVEQFRGNVSLTAVATYGNALFYLNPCLCPYGYGIGTGNTATTAAMPAAWTTLKPSSLFETNGKQFRIVSAGAIIRCVASATSAAGLVTFGSCPAIPINTVITFGTELYADAQIMALQPGMSMSWISQPQGPGARDFAVAGTSTSFIGDWTNLLVEVTGSTASSVVLNVEWFVNIEFQVTTNNALTAACRSNPPAVPVASAAVSRVHSTIGSFISGGVEEVEKMVFDSAKGALNDMMSDPLASIAGLFGM